MKLTALAFTLTSVVLHDFGESIPESLAALEQNPATVETDVYGRFSSLTLNGQNGQTYCSTEHTHCGEFKCDGGSGRSREKTDNDTRPKVAVAIHRAEHPHPGTAAFALCIVMRSPPMNAETPDTSAQYASV